MSEMAPAIITPRETPLQAPDTSQVSVPSRKRMKTEDIHDEGTAGGNGGIPPATTEPPTQFPKTTDLNSHEQKEKELVIIKTYTSGTISSAANKKARETRLEQNRKAARESRRRKKVMIEDLQRSVIFFSRANGALKHQNDELTRLLMQAQAQVSVIEIATSSASNTPSSAPTTALVAPPTSTNPQTLPPSSQNEPMAPLSATGEAKTTLAPAITALSPPPTTTYPAIPVMHPGATMQAMASFQQAAAAAMQVAVQGMQGISPGASLTSLAQPTATTGSASTQQAYNDTMTALAMQQAAIAAATVPPHLMAQIVGSAGGWATPAAAPTPVSSQATILPAMGSAKLTSAPATVPSAIGSGPERTTSTAVAAPVPVVPVPSPVAMSTQGAGDP
mmetsp:Transcript_1825/g.4361  ORF Transcript_1825/g.4361 Transcript_1825/m.4361 type:complete len:391 (-) Transcript_1825:527-1699(-)|eukprot:CAMPEP_0201124852 /NCGR_PEP_ID=MMETSP0850-20130426/17852_1 /ASSEMBLY_ACC=CAM_ASM_000622 /TAXON_ID=183588 /ORGANISM="Pseudo-nitzschia fraudulenta, Strain WWA7" /LENGTH=390 /DNA_ID=CAMNT_0047392527 /DNA_START=61 /DNA_END=1233 /DNA_ORIENTATION=+